MPPLSLPPPALADNEGDYSDTLNDFPQTSMVDFTQRFRSISLGKNDFHEKKPENLSNMSSPITSELSSESSYTNSFSSISADSSSESEENEDQHVHTDLYKANQHVLQDIDDHQKISYLQANDFQLPPAASGQLLKAKGQLVGLSEAKAKIHSESILNFLQANTDMACYAELCTGFAPNVQL